MPMVREKARVSLALACSQSTKQRIECQVNFFFNNTKVEIVAEFL